MPQSFQPKTDQPPETRVAEALEFIAGRLRPIVEESGPQSVAGIASPRLTNEDLFVFKRFMRDVVKTPNYDHHPRPDMALSGLDAEAKARLDRTLMPIQALDKARTIVLLGADPSQREPVMELRIRLALNRHGAKLVVLHPEEIALSAKASQGVMYPVSDLAGVARSLAAAARADRGQPARGDFDEGIRVLAETYLQEGPIALLYDDSFPWIADKADALNAVAELIDVLSVDLEVGAIPLLDDCNSMGARDLGVLPGEAWGTPVISEMLGADSQIRAAIILGSHLVQDVPDEATLRRLRQLDLLVVHELFLTETARQADVVLPAASFAEKSGTFTSTEGRIQALTAALPSPGMARADWEILVDLSQHFETALDFGSPEEIWEALRREVPKYADTGYADLGQKGVRPTALQRA